MKFLFSPWTGGPSMAGKAGSAGQARRWRRVVGAALAAFLFFAPQAEAGPLAPIITGIAAFLATPLGQIILGVGLQLAGSLLAKAKKPPAFGVRTQVAVGGGQPLSFMTGTGATAGSRVYAGTWGSAGKTPNAFFSDVVQLSDLPIAALDAIFVDGQRCTIEWGSPAQPQGYPVTEFRVGGVDHLWVLFADGTQTVADAFLSAKFGADPERPWTNDMIGRGCAYAVVTARFNRDLFKQLPALLFQTKGIKLYDPRKDTTAGGAGAHRRDDPATWEWSDNLAVIAHHIGFVGAWSGIPGASEWLFGLQNIPAARLPFAAWAAAMNACDEAMPLAAGGTEKRFAGGGEILCDRQPADVLEELMKSMSGRIADTGAQWRPQVGVPGAAVWAFTDADIVASEGQTLEPFPGLEATHNGVDALYPEPAEAWEKKEAPRRSDAAFIAADGGRTLIAGLEFPLVSSGTRVQRLMEAALADARRFRTHRLALPPIAWLIEPGDVLAWTSARNGYAAKLFLVTEIAGRRSFIQHAVLKEIDPADYDWGVGDELASNPVPVVPVLPPAQPMAGWQALPATFNDASGGARRPSVEVRYDGVQDDVRAVAVQVRLAATAAIAFDGETPFDAAGSRVLNAVFLPATDYQARGKYLPFSSRATDWSAWLAVTTPDTRMSVAEIGEDIRAAILDLRADVDRLKRDVPVGLAESSIDTANAVLARKSVRAQIGSRDALSVIEQSARIDGDMALASLLGLVSARADGLQAQGLFSVQAIAAPADAQVRIALYGRVDYGSSYQQAGLFIDVGGAAGSRIVLAADKTVVADSAGNALAVFNADGTFAADRIAAASISATHIATDSISVSDATADESDQTIVPGTPLVRNTLAASPLGTNNTLIVFEFDWVIQYTTPPGGWGGDITYSVQRSVGGGAWTTLKSWTVSYSGADGVGGAGAGTIAKTFVDLSATTQSVAYRLHFTFDPTDALNVTGGKITRSEAAMVAVLR